MMILERHVNLKYKYRSRYFWYREYYVDTVDKIINKEGCIKNQLKEGRIHDQMALKEYADLFND